MIRKTIHQLNRIGTLPLIAVGMLVVLWAASTAGASPPIRPMAAGSPPTMINYQGVVQVGGSPHDGPGHFKFAIVGSGSGDGTTNYWANDGTASGEPATAVPLAVSDGLFNVLLGDTSLPGMTQAVQDTTFGETDTFLRVWFSEHADGPFEALEPNQRIASVAYALRAKYAETLDSIPAGAVMFFDLEVCPDGWTPLGDAEGRVIVGIGESSGEVGGMVGDPLTDREDRTHTHDVDPTSTGTSPAGSHVHSVNPPSANTSTSGSHSHTIGDPTINTGVDTDTTTPYWVASQYHIHTISSSGSHTHSLDLPTFDSGGVGNHLHSVDIPSTASSAASTGEVIPYIQLLVCRKD